MSFITEVICKCIFTDVYMRNNYRPNRAFVWKWKREKKHEIAQRTHFILSNITYTHIMLKWWLSKRTSPQHEPLVRALHLSQSFSCYASFWKSCVAEGKEERETQSLAGVTIWDDEGWWPDVKSRLQSVKNSTGTHTFPVSSPPHPSKPFTYSSSRRWQNCQRQLLLWPGAGGLSHRLQSSCLLRLDKCVWFLKPAISVT